MSDQKDSFSREEIAGIEIGHTEITRVQKLVLSGVFLLAIFAVPVAQHVHEIRAYLAGESARPSAWPQCYDIVGTASDAAGMLTRREDAKASPGFIDRVLKANRAMLQGMHEYEDALEDKSLIRAALLSPTQSLLTGVLKVGNEEAYTGRGTWLFYRPGIEYLTGPGFLDEARLEARRKSGNEWHAAPQPDPRRAILEFKAYLEERGIALIVVPTPVKAVIHPERFSSRYEGCDHPVQNPSYERFKADLKESGVSVFDPAQALVEEKLKTAQPMYLETDTHWRPEAVELAARLLKEYIAQNVTLPPARATPYRREETAVSNLGDIAVMLKLREGQRLYSKQEVRLKQVLLDKNLWRPRKDADVLLLGDSFSNIYSLEGMGWGESAGLAEQLSTEMQRPIDTIIRNDGGAHATREMLSNELKQGRDRLAGKKLVIWQFAVRELSVGDWKQIDMKLGTPRPSRFFVPDRGTSVVATGVIEDLAPAPRPGSVPYKDHIVAVHLTEVESEDRSVRNAQALVYMWSMRGGVWTRVARYRPGVRLRLRLTHWQDVEEKYGRINTGLLDNEDIMLEDPCWGEELR